MGYLGLGNLYEVTKDNVEDHIDHIVNWIKKYFVKNGPDCKAVIGISGGKDSSIAAALCVRALGPDKVFGVLMPQGAQHDIDVAYDVCKDLGIQYCTVNIGETCSALYKALDIGYCSEDYERSIMGNSVVTTNTPARIRMTTLYAIAAVVGGRVCNTCNASEDYIGYSTKYGDSVGDFSPLSKYTVRDLLIIGEALDELDNRYVHKTPEDGMCGRSDEDNLGFTYDMLDSYILDGVTPPYDQFKKISLLHERNKHKLERMPICYRYDGRGEGWTL